MDFISTPKFTPNSFYNSLRHFTEKLADRWKHYILLSIFSLSYTFLKFQIPPSAPTTQSLWLRGFLYVSTFSAVLGGKNIFHYDNKKLKKRHFIFDFTNGNPSLQKRGVFFCFIQFQGLSPPSPNIPRSIPVPPRQYLSRSSPHRPAPTVPRHSHASTPEKHPSAASPLIDFCMRPDRIIR